MGLAAPGRVWPPQFKPPDVIAQLHAREEFGLCEFCEIAIDRGPIKAPLHKCIGNFCMRLRAVCGDEVLQHGQSRCGATQANRADTGFDGVVGGEVFCTHTSDSTPLLSGRAAPPLPP